jgi:hypothetical protein
MRNTADVTGDKPIAVLLQSISGVSAINLQNDLNIIFDWCTSNMMSLNVKKCHIISFTRKKNKLNNKYYLQDQSLNRKEIVKDLGVLFNEKLTFRPHYSLITERANKLLGFIIRSTKDFKKSSSILFLFFSLVRSILEYCCPIWSPYYEVHIDAIERVQKRCLKYVARKYYFGRSFKGYNERLSKFKMIPLHIRRKRYDLLCLHKIVHSTIGSAELLSSIAINTRYRSRCPNTFLINSYRNNTSFYNPIVRMYRTYNELNRVHNIDIFNSKFSVHKKLISNIFKS